MLPRTHAASIHSSNLHAHSGTIAHIISHVCPRKTQQARASSSSCLVNNNRPITQSAIYPNPQGATHHPTHTQNKQTSHRVKTKQRVCIQRSILSHTLQREQKPMQEKACISISIIVDVSPSTRITATHREREHTHPAGVGRV